MNSIAKKIIVNLTFERILAFVLLFCSVTALIYRVYRFDFFTIIAALVSSGIIISILNHFGAFFNVSPKSEKLKFKLNFKSWSWLFAAVGLAAMLVILWFHRTGEAIVTPWQLVPGWFFIVYFATVLAALISFRDSASSLWMVALCSFLVIPIIYSLGYGYDYFIHEASLRQIISTGVILPKTNYYLGQYTLLLLARKLFFIPYPLLHLWLVPLLSAIFLPWLIYKNTSDYQERAGWLLLLMLPYSFLTFTTPQNLGLLLLFIEIILLSKPNRNNLLLSCFLVLFNLTIHPISAIPALTLLMVTYLYSREIRHRSVFAISAALPLSIPVLLLVTGAANWRGLRSLGGLLSATPFALPNSEDVILNTVYSYYFNLPLLLLALLAVAYFSNKKRLGGLATNVGLSLGLLAAIVLMQSIELKNVISYEQSDYARRLLVISILILLPVLALLFSNLVKALSRLERKYQFLWLIFLAFTMTASFYLAYPRHDNYFNSRGLSVSRGDIEAVKYIENTSQGQSYVVLANQQVSAASLKEFGFAHYYNGNFYYPIPTTNPLYQFYLDMVYKKPSREIAQQARSLAGTDKTYLVLNKYWQDFPKLLEEAKLSADSYQGFADNSVYVFEYK